VDLLKRSKLDYEKTRICIKAEQKLAEVTFERQPRDQRLRDPVHGLITFRKDNKLDQLAWALLDAPEFQRLRRIKQLGPADLVFPGATHSRFAHCVGVFHTARGLLDVIKREIGAIRQTFNEPRAEVAVLAALLHDLGHGPLSHAFEAVQRARGRKKKHEKWSAEMVRNESGQIHARLERHRPGLAGEVADLLDDEDPKDIYHAVVSSSFDADRLDYLRRDRLMTGTQAGAIDFDWLMEHVRVRHVEIDAPDADDDDFTPIKVPTFCLDAKALPAAEQFLQARYTLHEQVYFHKVKRCAERMFEQLLKRVAKHVGSGEFTVQTGLASDHALARFIASDSLADYLALDDAVLWGGLEPMMRAGDAEIAQLAGRLHSRCLYKTLDISSIGDDLDKQVKWAKRIDRRLQAALTSGEALKDNEAKLSIYTQIGGDEERMHKKLHVLDGDDPKEISRRSRLVQTLIEPRTFTRYYFSTDSGRNAAVGLKEGLR
jgi:HD superfamily phosphohydrolase